MSVENGKICCNCRHCIRSEDEKYNIVVCRCDVHDMYLSYASVMGVCCKHWTKKQEGEETGGRIMTQQEIDRIECAIRHIESSLDVDPWACDIAVEAMEKQIPKKPMISIDVTNENLWHLYCPTCGSWVGMHNKRLKGTDMHNNTNCEICAKCGQAFDLELEGE